VALGLLSGLLPITPSSQELLRRNVKRFRGGLVFKAHRRFYHSTLGLRVIEKRKRITLLARRFCISQLWPHFTARVVNWVADWRLSILKWPVSRGVDFSKKSWLEVN